MRRPLLTAPGQRVLTGQMADEQTPKTNGDREVITVPEAAARLGISSWSYYERVKAGQVPFIRIGRSILVPVVQLNRLIEG